MKSGVWKCTFFFLLVILLFSFVPLVFAGGELADEEVTQFIQQIQSALEPYNRVGLFTPDVPNMYRYTAAEKD